MSGQVEFVITEIRHHARDDGRPPDLSLRMAGREAAERWVTITAVAPSGWGWFPTTRGIDRSKAVLTIDGPEEEWAGMEIGQTMTWYPS